MNQGENISIEELKKLKVIKAKCEKSLLFHTRYFMMQMQQRKFIVNSHHEIICEALERVIAGKCKRLIINIAPRYGKTELVILNFVSHALSINPKAKFIHLSYSDDLALDNSERTQDIIRSQAYQDLWPEVQIKKSSKAKDKWYTTSGGGVLARAAAGQVTGFGAGVVDDEEAIDWIEEIQPNTFGGAILIDDPIKPEDGDSDTKRELINSRFDSTIRNRVNSRNTPIIIIMQRLHPNDLVGYLQRPEENDNWEVISLPCLQEETYVNTDGKIVKTGKYTALWPFKHTVEELLAMMAANEVVFERQYQQNPAPKFGLMFPLADLKYYDHDSKMEEILDDCDGSYLAGDPANLGGDDFATIGTKLIGNKIYVPDITYNTLGTDYNEPLIADLVVRGKYTAVGIEGVFGWKECAIRIRKKLQTPKEERGLGWEGEFRILKPRTAKHVRISARQAFIRNHMHFRSDWQKIPEYRKFMMNLGAYLKIQTSAATNKHDEAPDVCEMAAGWYERNFPQVNWITIENINENAEQLRRI